MKEKNLKKVNGLVGLGLFLILLAIAGFLFYQANLYAREWLTLPAMVLIIVTFIFMTGLNIVQPNQARVFTFFGTYIGVIREPGFWFTTPLTSKRNVSLRVRNFNSDKLKVNDLEGNPIEIAAVIVFKVVDSAKAVFDVEKYEEFVRIQSETGLRHIASQYPYDDLDKKYPISLRQHSDEIADMLTSDLRTRLHVAGVEITEARIMHLAYSSEIASAMLQRQQAAAVLAARRVIVEGAVGVVVAAIEQLKENGVVELDNEKKAQMVNNLLVTIVAEKGNQPVVNTGSL